jgi:hypothetical protein
MSARDARRQPSPWPSPNRRRWLPIRFPAAATAKTAARSTLRRRDQRPIGQHPGQKRSRRAEGPRATSAARLVHRRRDRTRACAWARRRCGRARRNLEESPEAPRRASRPGASQGRVRCSPPSEDRPSARAVSPARWRAGGSAAPAQAGHRASAYRESLRGFGLAQLRPDLLCLPPAHASSHRRHLWRERWTSGLAETSGRQLARALSMSARSRQERLAPRRKRTDGDSRK